MAKRKTTKEFKREVHEMYPNHEYSVLGKYKNARTKIWMRHNNNKCSHKWKILPNNFLSGHQCPKCSNASRGKFRQHNTQWFKQQVNNRFPHHEYTVLSKYNRAMKKVWMHHNKCGYTWPVTPNNFLRSQGCPKCTRERNARKQRYDTKQFKQKVRPLIPTT